jgi:hypothetical protein
MSKDRNFLRFGAGELFSLELLLRCCLSSCCMSERGAVPGGAPHPSSGSSTSGSIGRNWRAPISSVSSSELQKAATGSIVDTST